MREINSKQIPEVLLVIENTDEANKIKLALKSGRFANRLLHVNTSSDAVKILVQSSSLPKLFLFDAQLSGLTDELLPNIKVDPGRPIIPVVLLGDESAIGSGVFPGLSISVMKKPFSFERFIEKLSGLGFHWLIVNQPPH